MRLAFKKAYLFVGITFLLSWLIASLFLAFGGSFFLMATAYMFVPMIVAIIIQKLIYREPIREPLGISFKVNRWFLVAWLLPPVIALGSLPISLLFPGVEWRGLKAEIDALPFYPILFRLMVGLAAGITVNGIAGFGEELGWRGFLQREMSSLTFWKSSAITGLVWGIWHFPIILQGHNYPEHPVAGVFMMVVFTVLLSPLFSYVRLKAQSVIAAAIMHGSLNATAGLSVWGLKGGSDLIIGVTGLAGFVVLVFVNIGFFVYDYYLTKEPIM